MNRRQCLQLIGGTLVASAAGASVPGFESDADEMRAELWNSERKHARLSIGDIAYCDTGDGPAALFLHGFPLNGFQWRAAIELLGIFHRCVAPDLMGMGFTRPAAGQDLAPRAQVAMLLELLNHLGIDRVHVVANDSGGAVAQLLAAHHPERVRTLLLTNCDTEIESPPAAMAPVIELAREGHYAERWLVPWLKDKKLARSPEGIGGMCFSDPAHPTDAAIDMYFGPLTDAAGRLALTDRYALALEDNPLAGIGARLKACNVPVRILWGMGDSIFSFKGAEYLHKTFGRSLGIRQVPGAKLFWPEEQPKLIAAEAGALWSAFPD